MATRATDPKPHKRKHRDITRFCGAQSKTYFIHGSPSFIQVANWLVCMTCVSPRADTAAQSQPQGGVTIAGALHTHPAGKPGWAHVPAGEHDVAVFAEPCGGWCWTCEAAGDAAGKPAEHWGGGYGWWGRRGSCWDDACAGTALEAAAGAAAAGGGGRGHGARNARAPAAAGGKIAFETLFRHCCM